MIQCCMQFEGLLLFRTLIKTIIIIIIIVRFFVNSPVYFRLLDRFALLIVCLFCREAAKPKPQSTHKVAVHIPSQEDVDSDSEIEEV